MKVDDGSSKRMQTSIRPALPSDAQGIIRIIDGHRRYDGAYKIGEKKSSSGFLMARLSVEEMREIIAKEPAVLVAERGGRMAGFVVGTRASSNLYEDLPGFAIKWYDRDVEGVYRRRSHIYLWMIGVDEAFQKKGVAIELMNAFQMRARDGGFEAVISDIMLTPVFNEASDGLFKRSGYGFCGVLTIGDYYGCGLSRWKIYSKIIDDR